MRTLCVFLWIMLTAVMQGTAQQDLLTAAIYADDSDDKVLLTFDAGKGREFSSVEFQYSTDGENFKTIGEFAYRKDSNSTAHLSFKHDIDFIGKVYYRVVLVSGNTSFSEVVPFDLSKWYGAVKVVPNPASSGTTIRFNNRFNYSCSVRIVNSVGKEVLSLVNYTGCRISMNTSMLEPGLYHFTIASDNGKLFFDGAIVVAH